MGTVCYPSLDDADVIDVEFLMLDGGTRVRRLLVDSGFTGRSSVILGHDALELIRAELTAAQATGALQGAQNRGWVTCRIPELSFQVTLIAIFTDISPLSLPPGVQGMAGLSFLRQFRRWGAERMPEGWRFYLGTGNG